eukprot:CAMPEP_0194058280 /NCGR_PEP_ID=MMETSP0009_2-20130614/65823_1 /TAXON_ID=210454 /ORGANISM="Grammatophora oceanica, Strain CCMP 410" /LENGTH=143 /DNA_ID=CAMNT_0038708359 /DNA_START=185 /DNA_END=613 /DNA_ORIENTATION=+
MGEEIQRVLQYHDQAEELLWTQEIQDAWATSLCLTATIFGFSATIAVLMDTMWVATLHLFLLQTFFRLMHRTQLYLLGAVGRLFRGKKRNPLRDRTDTMEHDAMQLLLGMILCMIVVFLFTTIVVYYAFFTAVYLCVQTVALC